MRGTATSISGRLRAPRSLASTTPVRRESLPAFADPCIRTPTYALARIFHSFRHRYDHLSARVTSAGGVRRICGLDSKPPLKRDDATAYNREQLSGAGKSQDLPGLSARHSGGGFASSPDVSACRLGPRIINSPHAGCRVECETSGLAERSPEDRAGACLQANFQPIASKLASYSWAQEPFTGDKMVRLQAGSYK